MGLGTPQNEEAKPCTFGAALSSKHVFFFFFLAAF